MPYTCEPTLPKRLTDAIFILISAGLVLLWLLGALPAGAALTETPHFGVGGAGPVATEYKDTSAANAQVVLTTTAKTYARVLSAVHVSCSASTTITPTQSIVRASEPDVLLPNIPLTATTSGAMYSSIYLMPTDTVAVTVPAAGAGITCTAAVIEEVH